MKAIEFVEGLKELAQFCIDNPDFEIGLDCATALRSTPKEMADAIRQMVNGEKSSTGDGQYDFMEFCRMFGPSQLRALIRHEAICERIVEVLDLPESIIPAKPAEPERVIPAGKREVARWKCPESILAIGAEKEE